MDHHLTIATDAEFAVAERSTGALSDADLALLARHPCNHIFTMLIEEVNEERTE
jgi:hypothetical protein